MQAVILAAGMGKRLKELTKDNTKCMVQVNGVTLIERMLRILDKKNLSRIVIVVGYEGKKLIDYVNGLNIQTRICYVENSIYDKTNNIYSLYLAKDYLVQEDTLLLESDLIFEEKVIDLLLQDEWDSLALVDKFENWMDGTCLVLDSENNITDFVPGKLLKFSEKAKYYKTVNIYKFSKQFTTELYLPFLEAYSVAMGNNEYYESVIKLILMLDKNTIKAKKLQGELWYEIDDAQDLDIAESLFAEDPHERYRRFVSRYGGYWRYPHLLDYCYLVNPYFPTTKMVDEIKSNFDTLLRQYPSGMQVNSLLAAKNFGVLREHIVVGNGAAELIKELLEYVEGTIGVIRPTFEEYPNRCQERCVVYDCTREDFRYDVKSITEYFGEKSVDAVVLVNPDNPTGHYLNKEECMKLLQWSEENGVVLIVDESFGDFAEEAFSLMDEEILINYTNLYVVKSISKSFGVAGLRLGVLASGNADVIDNIKKSIVIWNINSFAEFYMQIYEKYQAKYKEALDKIKQDRRDFYEQLTTIPELRVYPSEANYFMCELLNGRTSEALATELLKENILIKDLTGKIKNGKQYIRVAVRTREENACFIEALKRGLVDDYNK